MSELRLEKVSASYGQAAALADVSLSVASGAIVGLLGRNGAGKSTLLKAVVAHPSLSRRGIVTVDGDDISRRSTYYIARKGIAWVPDDRRIFTALSVRENLTLAQSKKAPKDQLERVIATVPLVRDLLHRRGYELSGGEQQAVTIARALMTNPSFILMDEPTEGLAPVIVEQLRDAILGIPAEFGCGIILAEQNFEFVTALAQTLNLLDTGRLVWAGTRDELQAAPEIIDRHLSISAG